MPHRHHLFLLSIAKKLWLLAGATAVAVIAITTVFLLSERTLILEERQSSVRQAVETAHGVVAHYHNLSTKGKLSEDEAKQAAIEEIKTLRYSGQEYFWINDMQAHMVVHPIKPELDGKDMSDNKDPNGLKLFLEFVNVVKTSGAGSVYYMWPKPGSDKPVQKVSYVKGFAPWGWVVGSGVYLDTVEETFMARLIKLSLVTLAVTGGLLVMCMLIARSITRPLNDAVRIAHTVAAGDLTTDITIETEDETGQMLHALQDMNSSLTKIVGEVRQGTSTVATASREIATANMDLASRTEQEASSLEETASAMEELIATVKQNAEHAKQANELAISASDVAGKGGSVVSQVVETMGAINQSAKKIVDIIGVIDGIAFQTNILALNAAVEAARAGDQGRGFAVVAAEVRQLAQRSASAAKEIKTLIDDSVDRINHGTKLVDQAGATMSEIVTSVGRVTNIMGEITTATREQTAGIEQINIAIAQMDQVTQRNAALVEQEAAAADSLQEQAANLEKLVSVFKVKEQGGLTRPAPAKLMSQRSETTRSIKQRT